MGDRASQEMLVGRARRLGSTISAGGGGREGSIFESRLRGYREDAQQVESMWKQERG
jgi:hypothetical protein